MTNADVVARIAAGGRIVIPAEFRREMGVKEGDEVLLRLSDKSVQILTRGQAIQRAQDLVRRHVPKGKSLVKELLKDRRKEAARE